MTVTYELPSYLVLRIGNFASEYIKNYEYEELLLLVLLISLLSLLSLLALLLLLAVNQILTVVSGNILGGRLFFGSKWLFGANYLLVTHCCSMAYGFSLTNCCI